MQSHTTPLHSNEGLPAANAQPVRAVGVLTREWAAGGEAGTRVPCSCPSLARVAVTPHRTRNTLAPVATQLALAPAGMPSSRIAIEHVAVVPTSDASLTAQSDVVGQQQAAHEG